MQVSNGIPPDVMKTIISYSNIKTGPKRIPPIKKCILITVYISAITKKTRRKSKDAMKTAKIGIFNHLR